MTDENQLVEQPQATEDVGEETEIVAVDGEVAELDLENSGYPSESPPAKKKAAANTQVVQRQVYHILEEAAETHNSDIIKLNDTMMDLAEQLDIKTETMLEEHKNDFFLAFKTHWFHIEAKFREVKQLAEKEEMKTRSDSKIQALDQELEYFMKNALRLDELCKAHKREVDKWRKKAEGLDCDRQFLEDQIKGARRQNKLLRACWEKNENRNKNDRNSYQIR